MGVSLLETYLRGGSSEVSQTSEPGGCWKEQWRSGVGGRRSAIAVGGQPCGSEWNKHPSKSCDTEEDGTGLMGRQCQPTELGREAAGNP
jgi:hypothetical protein